MARAKTLGYIIIMDSRAVRHVDSDPYWLQFSSFCELYPDYRAAEADVRKEMSKLAKMRGKVPARMLERWEQTLRIIPIRRPSSAGKAAKRAGEDGR